MKRANKKLKYLSGLFILFVIVVSSVFHYRIQIIDALNETPQSSFDIKISTLRIIFEPVFGPLLFFNRGLYALEELLFTLYCVLILFLIYSLFKLVTKERAVKKRYLLNQISNLPFIIGLWFATFIIIIFLSAYLPSNTITNNSPNTILVNTHSHSQFSHDGLISQENLWKWHKKNSFDAFFITEHNNHDRIIDFVTAQRNGDYPTHPLVIAGEEFSGTNHLSLLGLKRNFNTEGYTDQTAIDSTRGNRGTILVNHWFDGEHMTLEYYNNLGVDGFEIENTATDKACNREVYERIKNFCKSNNLLMVGGVDFHGYGNVCSLWNAMEIPDWHNLEMQEKEEAILDIIKNRDQSKLKVLKYDDRPYYKKEHLFWRPFATLFNYFRTLNIWQVLSWILWTVLIVTLNSKIKDSDKLKQIITWNKTLPVAAVLSSLFLLVLAAFYHAESVKLGGTDNDVYKEYNIILIFVGTALFLYSGVIAWFRLFRQNKYHLSQ
ncbi:MAG: PHP domain-containing protein [Bacteroidota bacterium]